MWTIDGEEVIVLGDKTTHGGEVITASANVSLLGKQVACVGDRVTCPRCEGIHTIISGAPRATAYDKAIARNGDSVSCGAKLISASAAISGDNSGMVSPGARQDSAEISPSKISSNFIHAINLNNVSATICTGKEKTLLDDEFDSVPSYTGNLHSPIPWIILREHSSLKVLGACRTLTVTY